VNTLYRTDEGFVVTLLETFEEQQLLLTLFDTVAKEKGWDTGTVLADCQPNSLYFALFFNDTLIGGIQVIKPNEAPLPIFGVWPELIKSDSTVGEFALLALKKEYRGNVRALWALCIEMWKYCPTVGITNLLVEVPVLRYQIYQRFGWSLEKIGVAKNHWGEKCYPCLLNIEKTGQSVSAMAAKAPLFLGFILKQAGR
jgi:hypothetical protein